jgi:hypothetical protein
LNRGDDTAPMVIHKWMFLVCAPASAKMPVDIFMRLSAVANVLIDQLLLPRKRPSRALSRLWPGDL